MWLLIILRLAYLCHMTESVLVQVTTYHLIDTKPWPKNNWTPGSNFQWNVYKNVRMHLKMSAAKLRKNSQLIFFLADVLLWHRNITFLHHIWCMFMKIKSSRYMPTLTHVIEICKARNAIWYFGNYRNNSPRIQIFVAKEWSQSNLLGLLNKMNILWGDTGVMAIRGNTNANFDDTSIDPIYNIQWEFL